MSSMRMKRPAVEATNQHKRSVHKKERKKRQRKTKKGAVRDVQGCRGMQTKERERTDGQKLTQGDVRICVWARMRSDVDSLKPGVWRPQAIVTH